MENVDVQIEEKNGEFMIAMLENGQIVEDTKKQINVVRGGKFEHLRDLKYYLESGLILFVKEGTEIDQGQITVKPKNGECCAVVFTRQVWAKDYYTDKDYGFVPFEWGLKPKTKINVIRK